MGDGRRHGYPDWLRGRRCRLPWWPRWLDDGTITSFGCLQDQVRGCADEVMPVIVEGLDEFRDLESSVSDQLSKPGKRNERVSTLFFRIASSR